MNDEFRQAVLQWGLPRMRDLPWRNTRDPWHVLVSEVMLQQTQVERVIPKWTAFLEVFPDPAACAPVPLGDVLRLWQGLGYPRRAQNLQRAARAIVHRGAFPDTLDSLLALPGVGAYTARAVLAFAFEIDAAVVDTNIARVFARVQGQPLRAKDVQTHADQALACGESWEWNQCLMDLGAVLCRSRAPVCGECPIAQWCAWRGRGDDPSVGSAGVSAPQSRFEGSDRQGRGKLIKRLGEGLVPVEDVSALVGWSAQPGRVDAMVDRLVSEGLIRRDHDVLTLP